METISIILASTTHQDIYLANKLVKLINENGNKYSITNDYLLADHVVLYTDDFSNGRERSLRFLADLVLNANKKSKIYVTGLLWKYEKDDIQNLINAIDNPNLIGINYDELLKLFGSYNSSCFEQYSENMKVILPIFCFVDQAN